MQIDLDYSQKQEVLDELTKRVDGCLRSLDMSTADWHANVAAVQTELLALHRRHEFESRVNQLLRTLQLSHVGFEHDDLDRCSAGRALAATYCPYESDGISYWAFQDVHVDGPADRVGIRMGDLLLEVDHKPFHPPEHPAFRMPSSANVLIRDASGRSILKCVTIPGPHSSVLTPKRKRPPAFVQPRSVAYREAAKDIGYIRLSSFPGAIGIEVANETDLALNNFRSSRGLIIDVRGNGGGGVGFMRLLSHLSTRPFVVGTFATDPRSLQLSSQEIDAFVLDEIPRSKGQLPLLAARFFWATAMSKIRHKQQLIRLEIRGGDAHAFHGNIAILTNQHTASAAEMMVAAAKEQELATIVGVPTAGRVRGGSKTKLPHGFWLMLPKGAFVTSGGANIDGAPVTPHVHVPFDPAAAMAGKDTQLEHALDIVRSV
jgi:C-terminal processing protease CtpA/Prc